LNIDIYFFLDSVGLAKPNKLFHSRGMYIVRAGLTNDTGFLFLCGYNQTFVGVLCAGDPRPGQLGGGPGGGDNSCTQHVVSVLTLMCFVAISFLFSRNW